MYHNELVRFLFENLKKYMKNRENLSIKSLHV